MIFIGSDTAFNLTGLQNADTGDYINDAEVTGYLLTLDEDELATFSYVYVDDSDGDYWGTLTAEQSELCTKCETYIVKIVATAGAATRTFTAEHMADVGGYNL